MRKFFLLTIVVLLLAGCAAKKRPLVQYYPVSVPELDQKSTAYLGDRLLMQATGFYGDRLELGNASGRYSNIKAGVYCKPPNATTEKYWSNDPQAVALKNLYGKILVFESYVTYDKELNKVCPGSQVGGCYDSSEISIKLTENAFCSDPNSFQQIIEYNGKTGNILNFTYREFSGGTARQAFTSDFKMDLNEGKIITYKGAILEVLDADNTQITYFVKRNFNK